MTTPCYVIDVVVVVVVVFAVVVTVRACQAHPPTEDVCLSARSFSENDLIAARDDAIEAKEKQIVMLNERCEALMDNVSTIEDTIPPLQAQLEE